MQACAMQLGGQLPPTALRRPSSSARGTRLRHAAPGMHTWPATTRRRCSTATVLAAYSTEALHSIRSAKLEASRQGRLFAGPEHLLIALLGRPSSAGRLLDSLAVDADSARATIDKGQALPVVDVMAATDVEFSPEARNALQAAAAAAADAGHDCTSTLHLLQGLLELPVAGAVAAVLAGAKADVAVVKAKVQEAAPQDTEAAGQQPPDAKAQADAIMQKYRQELAARGGKPPPPLSGQAWTAADDDMYN